MPDITMCNDALCPMRMMCYRFTAEPNELQSYFTDSPRKDSHCDFFWGDASQLLFERLQRIVNDQQTTGNQ